MSKTYKVVLFGASNSGKTTWIFNLLNMTDSSVKPTLGAEVHPFEYQGTNFEIWDVAGDESRMGLSMAHFYTADAFLIFYRTQEDYDKYFNMVNKCVNNTRVIHGWDTSNAELIDINCKDTRPIKQLMSYLVDG